MMKRTIGITGGTGFVGRHLTKMLLEEGYNVVVFTRHPAKLHKMSPGLSACFWDPYMPKFDLRFFSDLNAVIHLAGEGVADKRWTPKRKEEIVNSRVHGTSFLVQQLKEHAPQCEILVSASAIGYYGPDRTSASVPFSEEAAPYNDFLSNTCVQWENASKDAKDYLRRVVLRFGIVLGKDGGAFKEFAKPTSFGILPILGSGKQMVSWIHVDDAARMIVWALKKKEIEGVYNAVAPKPVSHKILMNAIAIEKGGIKIPVPVPSPLLKVALGEMSTEILKSCTVSGDKILGTGYEFKHKDIASAIRSLV